MTGFDPRWQRVTCRDCGRSWTCTPEEDYYGETAGGPPASATSGRCLSCSITAHGLSSHKPPARQLAPADVDHARCAELFRDGMAPDEVTVSTTPPIAIGPFTTEGVTCPHGVTYWVEPTAGQLRRWQAGETE